MKIRLKPSVPGKESHLVVEAPGIRGGEYEFRLASHQDEFELPFLALPFLERMAAALQRLLATPSLSLSTTDPMEPHLRLRQTADRQGVAVMWGRGVLAQVKSPSMPETQVVNEALKLAIQQVTEWRNELGSRYGIKSSKLDTH